MLSLVCRGKGNLSEKEKKERKQEIRREKNREAVKRCRQVPFTISNWQR
jgi:hypothetical protein